VPRQEYSRELKIATNARDRLRKGYRGSGSHVSAQPQAVGASTRIAYERLATFPPSSYQLTDSELRFVQAHLPTMARTAPVQTICLFLPACRFDSSTLGTVRRLNTILSSFQVQTCPIIKYNPSGV
jgi:hypothetical protein